MPEKDKEEEKESPEKTPVETQDEEVVEESRPKAVVEEVKETEPLQEEQLKPEEVEPKASGNFKVVFITALITAIIVASLAGGIYVYLSGVGKLPEVSGETPKPVPTVTPTPTATPEPELDLSVYKVQVLNGSGTAGAAGAAEDSSLAAGPELVGFPQLPRSQKHRALAAPRRHGWPRPAPRAANSCRTACIPS